MDTESFGLLLADSFVINWNGTGSKAYPALAWSTVLTPTQTMQIDGAVYSRHLSSFAFVNFTVTRDASNVPTLSWASGASKSSGLGGNSNDTSNAQINEVSSSPADCFSKVLSFGGEKRPDIVVTVFAG
jgi:hypothetical protein